MPRIGFSSLDFGEYERPTGSTMPKGALYYTKEPKGLARFFKTSCDKKVGEDTRHLNRASLARLISESVTPPEGMKQDDFRKLIRKKIDLDVNNYAAPDESLQKFVERILRQVNINPKGVPSKPALEAIEEEIPQDAIQPSDLEPLVAEIEKAIQELPDENPLAVTAKELVGKVRKAVLPEEIKAAKDQLLICRDQIDLQKNLQLSAELYNSIQDKSGRLPRLFEASFILQSIKGFYELSEKTKDCIINKGLNASKDQGNCMKNELTNNAL